MKANKWFGDAAFYRMVLHVAVPLIIQQMITSFVNMLDNIMVGQVGTLAMSGVSIANQLTTIFNLAVFGSVAACSIFGAQFFGKKDMQGMQYCLRFKLVIELVITLAVTCLFLTFSKPLIQLFLSSSANSAEDIALTMQYAHSYLLIMMIGFLPFALTQCLTTTFSETGRTKLPMVSSIIAVSTNFVFNWILIFGHFGLPALGSDGAAIATVISRFVELAVVSYFVINFKQDFPFFHNLLKGFHIPKNLMKQIIIKGLPLMMNEVLWSTGIACITQCYSVRGIDAVAAYNITTTIQNLFFVFNIGMGNSISIIVGQKLGTGKLEEAVDTDRKMILFTFIVSIMIGAALWIAAPLFPALYNTSEYIRQTSTNMLHIAGIALWIGSIYNACYFTLRCGGKTIITFLFDSVGTMFISFPVAYILAHYTELSIVHMFFILQFVDLYKVILGLFLLHKRIWVNDLVAN